MVWESPKHTLLGCCKAWSLNFFLVALETHSDVNQLLQRKPSVVSPTSSPLLGEMNA